MINKIFSYQIREYLLYSISFALNKLGLFILLPLYTKVLAIEEYGYFELITTIVAFVIPIGLLGIDSAVLRFYSYSDNKLNNTVNKSINNLYSKSLAIYMIFIIILYFSYFSDLPNSKFIVFLLFFKIIIDSFLKIELNRLRMSENVSLYFRTNLVIFLSTIILAFVLIKIIDNSLLALLISYCLGGVLPTIHLFIKIKPKFNFSLRFTKIEKEIYNYCLPIVLIVVVNIALSLSDRFIIEYYLGFEELGLYSAGFRLASLVQLCTMGFLISWPSKALKMKESINSEVLVSKYVSKIVLILSTMTLIITILIRMGYTYFYPENYHESFKVVPFISISFLLLTLESYFSIGIFYSKKTNIKLVISLVCLAINILLNILFVTEFGYVFAAYSTLISSLFLIVLSYIFSKKYFRLNNMGINILVLFVFLIINYILWIF